MKCQISDSEWIDLSSVRRIQFEVKPPLAIITWFDGSTQVYNGDEATGLVNAWLQVDARADDFFNLEGWGMDKEGEILQVLLRRGGRLPLIDLLEITDAPYSALKRLESTGVLFIQGEITILAILSS